MNNPTPLKPTILLPFLMIGAHVLLSSCAISVEKPAVTFVDNPVYASVETDAVASADDAADDPVIWVHPKDMNKSLVIGTNKRLGIESYNLQGERQQFLEAGYTNNVDLRYLEDNPYWSAIAAASNRTAATISLFGINHQGEITWLRESEIETALSAPYGLCMYLDDAGIQVFVNDKDGRYQQWLLQSDFSSVLSITAELKREFKVNSQPEGCVADDENQRLFVGEENYGIWTVSANFNHGAELASLATIDGARLVADVEGLTLYKQGSAGYLIVSSQGNNSYSLYDRLPPFSFRGQFQIQSGVIDGTSDTDGIDVSAAIRTKEFPQGLFVAQDGSNTLPRDKQNFKLVSWKDIADTLKL